jgi:hypothetical protein
VPPSFDDILEPEVSGLFSSRDWVSLPFVRGAVEFRVWFQLADSFHPSSQDYSAGMTYYGDKAKPRPYEARFASPDR